MKIIKEPIAGALLVDGDLAALRLEQPESENLIYLTYAFVTQGPGHHILPSVLLDDWGKEIGRMGLYHWVQENGQRFPRAELFGVEPSGAPAQYFLRDLELLARHPLYAFAGKNAAPDSAVLVRAILRPDEAANEPQRATPPDDVTYPLVKANVAWWWVNPRHIGLDFLHDR